MSGPLTLLAQAQRAGRLPSMTAGLVRDGGLVWSGRVGRDRGPQAGEDVDTQHRIGSITKTFTAVLVHQAVRDGLLDLGAPLSAYLPEVPFGDRTLGAVLSHTAGLPKEPVGPWWERAPGADFAALVAANADVTPMAEPGVEHRYSNLGYGLLGEVLSRVCEDDWFSLVRRRVLEPLGMDRTTYQATTPHAQGWSVSHRLSTLTPEPHSDTGAMAPAGQLWSTLTDLATYAGFLTRGHPDVLSLDTLERAATEVLPGSQYGLGFRLVPYGARTLVGHTGTMPGFMASCFVDRQTGDGFVGFANGTVGQQSVGLAADLLRAIDEQPGVAGDPWLPTVEVPDLALDLVGSWFWGERAFELRWDSGRLLMVELRGGAVHAAYHLTDTGWRANDRTLLEVVRHADGRVSHLLSETYLFTRTPYDPMTPVPGGAAPRC